MHGNDSRVERVHQLARHGTGTYLWGRRRGRGASEKREKSATTTTTTTTTTKEAPLGDQRRQTCAHLLDLGQPEVEGGVQPTEELSSPHKIRPPGLVHLVRPDSDTTTTPSFPFLPLALLCRSNASGSGTELTHVCVFSAPFFRTPAPELSSRGSKEKHPTVISPEISPGNVHMLRGEFILAS